MFAEQFPYLNSPVGGSPNKSITIGLATSPTINGPFHSVLFQDLKAGYEAATRTLSVPKPGPDSGFVRINSDRKVQLANPQVNSTTISTQIK